MIRFIILGIGLLSMTGCGAYFVTTGDLASHHQEGIAPLGAWAVDDLHIVFEDGSETADQLCVRGEDEHSIWMDVHMVPVDNGSLIILSNLVSSQDNGINRYDGSLIYGLEREGDDLFQIQPFQNIEEGDTLPFATECPVDPVEGTLAESSFVPFCMASDVTPSDIMGWISEQDGLERTLLVPLTVSEVPVFCADPKPATGQ